MAETQEVAVATGLEEGNLQGAAEFAQKRRECSLTCILDALFFTVRPDDITDTEAVSAQAFGLLVILVGYLQQLGLLVLEELDFGLWGNVFGNINIISLNINIEFNELQGDIGYLVAVYLFPVAIMLWYIKADADDAETEKSYTCLWRVGWLLDVLFLSAFVAVGVLVDFATGVIFAIPLGYMLLLQVGYKMRDLYLRTSFKAHSEEDEERKRSFFLREIAYNDLAITFSLPLVATTWVSVGLLNANETVSLVGGIVGGVLIVWLLIRFYLRTAGAYTNDFGKCYDVLKWIFLGLLIEKHIYNGSGSQDFKDALFFFPVLIYLEKICLAIIPTLAVSDLFDTDDKLRATEIAEYIVLAIIYTNFAIFAIFWPLKSKISLRAEIFSRLSNLLIFSFALVNTRFRRNQEDELEEGEDTEEELYVSIVMIVISTYMLIFWLRLLDPKEFVKFVYKANTDFIYGLWAKHKWRKVANAADAAKIILPRKKQQVTENEYRVLPYIKNFCAFCVQRTRELTVEDEELVQVQNDGVLEITYESAKGVDMDVLRRFGFGNLKGLKCLKLSQYENSLADFEVLVNSGMLENLFHNGTRGFGLEFRYITAEEVEYLFNELYKVPCETLEFAYCIDDQYHDATAFAQVFARKVAECQHLKVFYSESNSFPSGTSLSLIESLFSLPNLKVLTLAEANLSDEEYKLVAKLLVETDHEIEELHFQDNKPKSLESLEEVAEAAMQTKMLRTLDLSANGIYVNKVYMMQEKYPDLKLVADGYGYLDFKSERGESCNVVLIKSRTQPMECLTRDGFTEDFVSEIEGPCCLLSSFLYFLNDEWKQVAREHIHDTFQRDGYGDEAESADDDETVLFDVTLADIVMKHGDGEPMILHTLERLKEFGFDIGKAGNFRKAKVRNSSSKTKEEQLDQDFDIDKLSLKDLEIDPAVLEEIDNLDLDKLSLNDLDIDMTDVKTVDLGIEPLGDDFDL